MSVELPWSTRLFLIMQLAISTLIIMGLSCIGLITLKSSDVKLMGGMLGAQCRETILTDQTCYMFLFRAKALAYPPEKPMMMMFMTHLCWSRGPSSISLEQLRLLYFFEQPACSPSLPWLDYGVYELLGLFDCGL